MPLPRRLLPRSGFGRRSVHPAAHHRLRSRDQRGPLRADARQAADRSPPRGRADGHRLPLPDACVTVAAIDRLLFPAETARVLSPDKVLLWIDQLGADGPLYLAADDVAAALPGDWRAVEAEADWGSWALLRRIG